MRLFMDLSRTELLRSSYLFNFSRLGFIRNKIKEDIIEELPQPPRHDDHTYCLKVGVNCQNQIQKNIIFRNKINQSMLDVGIRDQYLHPPVTWWNSIFRLPESGHSSN